MFHLCGDFVMNDSLLILVDDINTKFKVVLGL